MTDISAKMGNWNRLRLLSAGLLILWAGGGAMHAAKLDPGTWKIYPLNAPKPPSGLLATNPIALPSGTNLGAPSSPNVLKNLTDNNPATLVTLTNSGTNSIGLFIDLWQTNVVDRVFLIGGNHHLNLWPDNYPNRDNPPLGLIIVSIGNSDAMMKQVGTWTVPYDAGNPVDTEVDLRFSPAAGRYVQIQLQTNVTWGVNHWPGYALASQPPAPANLTWNVGEVEIYGFSGPVTNLNAVVCDSTNQPLQIAASDLSYYLEELTGTPHPIITSSQTNLYPGRIYRIVDLVSLAPDYNTMMRNIASGALPTNLVVSVVGREVQFSGWPYRCVLWGVWEFLERQGVRWLYPDGHGDFVPTGSGVTLNMLPLQVKPSAYSIGAPLNCESLHPWPYWDSQSVRQGYLYPWRNHCNFAASVGPIGGAEIPKMSAPGGIVNSNYTEGFAGYPHNFDSVVPTRILLENTNWWSYDAALGYRVNPTNAGVRTFCMDNPDLIAWVAAKMTNVAAVQPAEVIRPLELAFYFGSFGLYPMDSTSYCEDPLYCAPNNSSEGPNPVPGAIAAPYDAVNASGSYYYFVNEVAKAVKQSGSDARVGALAYWNVEAPPTNITNFSDNVEVQVCLYGAWNLPMSDPENAGMKGLLESWRSKCSRLRTYGYSLLHTDFGNIHPELPVPLVAAIVDHAKYFASIGALDGSCQGNETSVQFNPWSFYAYPRIRWNTNQTAGQLETEFFNGYFREAAAPMLAYYQGLENYQFTNGVDMRYFNCAYGITPNSFPLSVLAAMQTNLQAAELAATNWYVIARVADMRSGFDWVITNAGLYGVSLTNTSLYPVIGSTNSPYHVTLADMVAFVPGHAPYSDWINWSNPLPNTWEFWGISQLQKTFYVAPGTYNVAITAFGVEYVGVWPVMNVCFGPKHESVSVNTTNWATYNRTFTVPAGVWDLAITFKNPYGSERNFYIDDIWITRQ